MNALKKQNQNDVSLENNYKFPTKNIILNLRARSRWFAESQANRTQLSFKIDFRNIRGHFLPLACIFDNEVPGNVKIIQKKCFRPSTCLQKRNDRWLASKHLFATKNVGCKCLIGSAHLHQIIKLNIAANKIMSYHHQPANKNSVRINDHLFGKNRSNLSEEIV